MVTGNLTREPGADKNPPVEGKLVRGNQRVNVGDHLRVRLLSTAMWTKVFIDFAQVSSESFLFRCSKLSGACAAAELELGVRFAVESKEKAKSNNPTRIRLRPR